MTEPTPVLYVDLGSPYAYLAAKRARAVLGVQPRLVPILVGGIFVLRGHGSWAHTTERAAQIAEVEARAARYGLPPVRWPADWPNNTLNAMRAATWADQRGAGPRFIHAAFDAAFVESRDLHGIETLHQIAIAAGLPADELPAAIRDPTVKQALKDATARAWDAGVVGVPCLQIEAEIFYGDDQLERAARRLSAVDA